MSNFKANETGDTWTTVTWTPIGNIYSYKLAYKENSGLENYVTPKPSATHYTLTNLKPGITYAITLTPYSMFASGQPSVLTVMTCGGSKSEKIPKHY